MRTATPDTRRALRACAACGLIDAPYYDADGLCPLCSPEFNERHGSNGKESGVIRAVESSTTYDLNQSPSELQRRALDAITTYGGIRPAARALGDKLGEKVNHGVIGLAARGEDFPKARHVLGLPPEPVPVYPCPECGQVHKQLKSCRPSPRSGKRRLAFSLTDEQFERVKAAIDNHPGGRVAWLMENVQ